MWLILASASPRKPYVPIELRSSKAFNFEVVNRSQRIDKSSFCKNLELVYYTASITYIDAMAIVGDLQ